MVEKSPRTVAVSSGAEAFLAQMKELGSVRYMFANTGTDHGPLIEAMAKTAKEDLLFIKELLEAGKVVPIIDKCYPLHETVQAIKYLIEEHGRGKVVITT